MSGTGMSGTGMSGTGTLRALKLSEPQGSHSPLAPPSNLCVGLAILAIVMQLTVSANMLTMFGIAYNTEGGNPLIKFHPGTYLAIFALIARLGSSGQPLRTLAQMQRRFPLAILFLAMFGVCMVWVVANTGISGVAIYVESYVAAGVLYLVIADMSPRQRRVLAWIMIALFVLNSLIAVGETMVRHTIMPVYLAHGVIFHDVDYEFRGLALYDHALTGGLMTQMGLLLLVGMRMSPRLAVPLGVAMFLGLISFGGRTSLLFSMATLLVLGAWFMVRGLLTRSIRPGVIVAAVVGLALAAVLLTYVITETSLGVRLAGKLSFNDDSADARSVQWLMPGLLTWSEWLFGISTPRLVEYIYQLSLKYPFQIVENFWLVSFMNLGAIMFLLYLIGFFGFLTGLWRSAPLLGRAIVVTTIIVASTSNSLGRKSNVLFVMTAAVVATTGFARTRSEAVRVMSPVLAGGDRPGGLRALGVAARASGGDAGFALVTQAAARAPAPPAATQAAATQAAATTQGSVSGVSPALGSLVREQTPPDRALRPLRLTTARS